MLAYDLQRYHPEFVISVVDEVFENIRQGLEVCLIIFCRFWFTIAHGWDVSLPKDQSLQVQSTKNINHEVLRRDVYLPPNQLFSYL